MKRLVLVFVLMAVPSAAVAFDPAPARGNRIGILTTVAAEDDVETLRVAAMMRGYLARQLRREGFQAFDARATFDEIDRGRTTDADYYVEFMRAEASSDPYGGGAVAGRHGAVDLALVVSHIAAGLRIYDGRTLEIIDDVDVQARSRAVVPTAIGLGQRGLGVWVGLPVGLMRSRSVAKEAARDAAESIAAILETEAVRN